MGDWIFIGYIKNKGCGTNMKKKSVKNKVFIMMFGSILLTTIVFLILLYNQNSAESKNEEKSVVNEYIVELNEISQGYLMDADDSVEKISDLMERMREDRESANKSESSILVISYVLLMVTEVVIFIYIYFIILKPFDELEEYAEIIASGNLEKDFKYKRVNMFGKFTWAFDHMRTEIIKARKNEQAAIENNKTVIATLSHDIKTPIASIRGYAEALTMNLDNNVQRRNRYANVIMKKCDEVTKITNDMFIHSLHDLDHLILKKEKVNIGKIITDIINDMNIDNVINIKGEIIEAEIENADSNRIVQVIENIISNAKKYAKEGNIDIATSISDSAVDDLENLDMNCDRVYIVSIKDYGKGITDEDMPFVFDKFYRGKNIENEQGAGLGLFIAKYIMEQMNGKIQLYNDNGLMVKLYFPLS